MNRLFFIILVTLSAVFITRAQNAYLEKGEEIPPLPKYVIVTINDTTAITVLPDSVFNAIAARTIYRVSSTKLNRQDSVLREMTQTLKYLGDSSRHFRLKGLEYRGAASPEGPYHFNEYLSEARAEAFINYLGEYVDVSRVNTVLKRTVSEDYPYLLWLMEQADDPEAHIVRRLLEHYGLERHAELKKALRSYDHERLWRRLLKQYYPKLRAARVVLYFDTDGTDAQWLENQTRRMLLALQGAPEPPLLPTVAYVPPSFAPKADYRWPKRHVLSISTNLLFDALYMPHFGWAPGVNVGLEIYPRGRYTVRGQFTFPYYHKWGDHKFFQIRDYRLEVRRYFNPGWWHTGCYLGLFAEATKYGIGLKNGKGWQGEGAGGSLKLGYVVPLGRGNWRLDFHIAAGAWYTRYDPYVYGNPITGEITGNDKDDYFYEWVGDPEDFKRRNHQLTYFGVTDIGITLTFDLLYRRLPPPNHRR